MTKTLDQCLVLIVDDVISNTMLLSRALGKEYRVKALHTGSEAIAFARSHHPDLILLDVMMPGMDGFTVCRTIMADPVLSSRHNMVPPYSSLF